MCKAFIFDLDGVITDTAELHFQAWSKLALEENLVFTREINEQLRGISRRDSLDIILAENVRSESQIAKMMERKNDVYLDLLNSITKDDILPGILELLLELNARQIKVVLASASRNARGILLRLGLIPLFDAIADGWSVERSKPAPDVFIHAAGQVGVNANDCVVVEDAQAGVEAGKTAGMKVIGIGPESRVGAADWRVDDTAAINLKQVLEQF
ncbi:beta-phosphoglucomutase [Alginatibacterium sediminis]|uniref:Beta-phosphoglucomutase n=1 Tax=Alginatibacterium sediminis TaxID=2164068 RepID=A0A420ECR6_9ALTE|nr:beta-phosphoglucomutase [Alginatibacterium sediminis]RKF18529.1 beta-phosphoglucomutase [Alginatibacterium sediminis]